MKKLLLLLIACFLISILAGAPVSRETALALASAWQEAVLPEHAIASVQAAAAPNDPSLADWYVINFAPRGFLLVSAEDKAVPILAYSTEFNCPAQDLPSNLQWFLSEYHGELGLLRSEQELAAHPQWQLVLTGDLSDFIPQRPVSPLLQTTWDQSWPYNSLCPSDAQGSGGHTLAGCGATTMGQIMKYWQYPVHGIGSNSYSHPTYGMISANFADATYNYASMPNSLWFTANTAVSTLLFHCGVAVDMDYGPNASGSSISDIRPAFINHFGYESTAQTVYKYGYTATAWDNLMKNELDHSRPIFYFGQDPSSGGHAWACDGYQGTNYFHMNWGWSGSYNGYFYLSNLSAGGYNFSSQQGAVIGLRPQMPVAPPTNLVATVDAGNNVFLEWQSPATRALLGFTIYRNGAVLATITDPLTINHYDINLPAGTYQYYVVANFTQGDSEPSNTVVATVYPAPVINYQDSFENHPDFAADLAPWISLDLDQANTLTFDYTDFPAEGEPHSFLVFNPAACVPPVPELTAFDEQKLLVCLPSDGAANDDWLFTPKWNTGNQARMRFWARSAFADSGLAQIRVGISTAAPDPATMEIVSGGQPLSVPAAWTGYEYVFSTHLYANVFAGIHCLSDNGSLLLLDRFQLWSSYVGNPDAESAPATGTALSVHPNPFRASASIHWIQKAGETVTLEVYDVKGRLVTTLASAQKAAGEHDLAWDGKDDSGSLLAAGIYFCRLTTDAGTAQVRKMVKIN